ncbi:MAG: dockerin type I repeat-containing protein [Ruminococcus sp.]|nr:dockerin type I repeat-containing protein [Ruminococcus sp.]
MKTTRIIIAFLLTAIMILMCCAAPVSAASFDRLLGDSDGDGTVTILDATAIQKFLASLIPLGGNDKNASDVDADGSVSVLDVTYIQKSLAKLPAPDGIEKVSDAHTVTNASAIKGLKARLDSEREALYVYKDAEAFENHFPLRTKMANGYGATGYVEMEEYWSQDPHSGKTCIRCEGPSYQGSWVVWRFLNGYMTEDGKGPYLNKGEAPGQGMDLTGADALRFYARGEKGGERVVFSFGGYGYSGPYPNVDYPDSNAEVQITVTLTDTWQEYVIPLNDNNYDLSCIANGFEFTLYDTLNDGEDNVAFYLDDIRYVGEMDCLKNAPFFLLSYDTDEKELKNTAYTYDNAVAAMAFLCADEKEYAEVILDAFEFAVGHDRYQNGRIRNSYIAGDISSFPGWNTGTRFATFWSNSGWAEDPYQVGCNVGNTSFAALALLQYDQKYNTDKYLSTAKILMDWVIDECSGTGVGFTGGYDGWPEKGENQVSRHTYKSLEHNIDAYAAFKQLYAVTGEKKYGDAADSALHLIESLYNPDTGYFYTGTLDDGVTPNTDVVVLDVQVWSAMALGELYDPYVSALDLVADMKTEEGAYPFCQENKNGGYWLEGTAFTALMYHLIGDSATYREATFAMCDLQIGSGLFPAATVDHLSTGITLYDGSPWEYGTSPHIVPTAWFVLAENSFNPYTFS